MKTCRKVRDRPSRLLSYNFWRRDFSADPSVVGRVLRLDGKPVTVVGILPRDFEFGPAGVVPIWVPLHLNNYETTARGRPLVECHREARARRHAWSRRAPRWTPSTRNWRAQYPRENAAVTVDVEPLRSEIVGNIRPLLLVLFGAVCFVLLIACANIANLMMSRSIDRRREFAVRAALGAKQIHLVLQLLIESLLLSVAGAIVGFLGAAIGVWLLVRSVPEAQLDRDAVSGGCWHQLSGDGLHCRHHCADGHSLRPGAGTCPSRKPRSPKC